MAKQDVLVELFYEAVWNDHTDEVLARDDIEITRGRADESGQPAPSAAALTFTGWRFNPRNPASDLFGLIGRNTPIRVLVGTSTRFMGEVASWTPRQTLGGPNQTPDRWVEVEAAGITRRLGQGADPLRSVVFREVMSADNEPHRVAYWPCEDGTRATQLSSPMAGVPPMSFTPGAVQPGSYSGFDGSDPLATIAAGVQPGGPDSARGGIPAYTGDFFSRALFAIPTDGFVDGGQMMAVFFSGGSIGEVELEYVGEESGALNGSVHLAIFDQDGVRISPGPSFDAALDGTQFLISIELEQNGADVDVLLFIRKVGLDGTVAAGTLDPQTLTGHTLGTAREVHMGGTTVDNMSFGHVMIGTSQSLVFNISSALAGWIGEHAGRRIERLCDEEGVTFAAFGDLDDTQPMGPQHSGTLLEILREAADLDGGVLTDGGTGVPNVSYLIGRRAYSRAAALELDYDQAEVAPPLEPVIDDQAARNDVIATRRDGGEQRAVDVDGPLGVDTIGRYKASVELNTMSDGHDLAGQAGWRLHLGTTDEIRWPQVTVDLVATSIPSLSAAGAIGVGDRITVDNLPAGLTPDLAHLLVQGWKEKIGSHTRKITFNCTPEEPYHIAEVEHAEYSIIGSDRSVLNTSIDATQTTIPVHEQATGNLQLWTHEVDFDILVGGERMTVTAIGPPDPFAQDFTVVRSVNGVVKAHATGTPVDVFHRSYIGL